jgi:hypothetical protein
MVLSSADALGQDVLSCWTTFVRVTYRPVLVIRRSPDLAACHAPASDGRFGQEMARLLLGGHAVGAVAFSEEDASATVDCAGLDGERELGERSCQPMPRGNVGGQFVVAAANILNKGMANADHPYGSELFETTHQP